MTTTIAELRERLAQISDLGAASELLSWDQQTQMPAAGASARADAQATLARVIHERMADPRLGELLAAAAAELAGGDPQSDDALLVRKAQRDFERTRLVPDDLAAELAHAGSIGRDVWISARANDDFATFAPYLKRNVELTRRYVDCVAQLGGFDCDYDVLLDDYDPGMRTAEVARLFAALKDELVPVIATLGPRELDASVLSAQFDVAAQRQLVAQVVARMGFSADGWRLDDTVHPFATDIGRGDVRITTRYTPRYFPTALFGAMHECGHGLYSDGVAPELARSPLGQLDSLSLHESQSRLWENMVGRSRAFSSWLAPRIAALAGGELGRLDGETLFRAVNGVTPSPIRIEADETTYALHIVLRFELEQELVEGRLTVDTLPAAWNERMRDYLGVEVSSDADGVLQDTHWASGLIGYFPTYALGNLVSGHLWQRVQAQLPALDAQLAQGELAPLREWLRLNVHQHGSKYTALELVRRVSGEQLSVAPFVAYLKAKLEDVYGAGH